jgi:predicted dinucleotide-binding enzyme
MARTSIGIIGAGNMGSAFAKRLGAAGHDIAITARDPAHAEQAAASAGGSVRAVPRNEIARDASVVILATYFPDAPDALRAAGDLAGKTVIDITNPVTPDMSGLSVGHTTSAAEEIQRAVPNARVVKAFNTVFAQVLGHPPSGGNAARVQVFYAGDDAAAKETVRSLVESIGFEAVDAGPLRNARLLEPMGMLNIYLGYVAGRGTDIAFASRKVAEPALEAYADRVAPDPGSPRTQSARQEESRPPRG